MYTKLGHFKAHNSMTIYLVLQNNSVSWQYTMIPGYFVTQNWNSKFVILPITIIIEQVVSNLKLSTYLKLPLICTPSYINTSWNDTYAKSDWLCKIGACYLFQLLTLDQIHFHFHLIQMMLELWLVGTGSISWGQKLWKVILYCGESHMITNIVSGPGMPYRFVLIAIVQIMIHTIYILYQFD